MSACAILALGAFVSLFRSGNAATADLWCAEGQNNVKGKFQPIRVDGRQGETTEQTVQVAFTCMHIGKAWHIHFCHVQTDKKEIYISEESSLSFTGTDGWRYKIGCNEFTAPKLTFGDFASAACSEKTVGKAMSVDVAKSAAFVNAPQVKMKFECDAKTLKIAKCFLMEGASATADEGIDAGTNGKRGGKSGEMFIVDCVADDKPSVVQKFFPEICKEGNKVADILLKTSSSGHYALQPTTPAKPVMKTIRFECDGERAITKCIPPYGSNGIVPGKPDTFTKMGGSKYRLYCETDKQPTLTKV